MTFRHRTYVQYSRAHEVPVVPIVPAATIQDTNGPADRDDFAGWARRETLQNSLRVHGRLHDNSATSEKAARRVA